MSVESYKMGPGTLTLGSGPLDVTAQITKFTVEADESVDTEDAIDVLSGEQIAEEETASYKWKATGTALQDELADSGFVAYTWDNMGVTVAFKFIPATSLGRKVTGNLRVVPLAIGGDVKKRNTSDLSWSIIGTPVLGDTP